MQVKLYASLRLAAGTKILEIDVSPTASMRDVLLEVTNRFPVLVKFIWKEGGELSEHAHVFINGENVRHLSGLDTILKPDDHVDIFPPVVGG
jgi:molybdopterin synthase sulfur carrier subunit